MPQPKSKRVNRDQYDAVLFDLDGVITNTANLHATCWKQMFDEYLQKRRGLPALRGWEAPLRRCS
jgi:phosphoglycolate phosphatase-like HAD superfamily hydrolase